jgi:hypothetical protein
MLVAAMEGGLIFCSGLVQENTFRELCDRRDLYIRLGGWIVLFSPTGISFFGLCGRQNDNGS